ncbi:unnamed protein product [Rotaria magnacalcarata]|uniref:Uncharacterized protein n=2 Tax=Rotaria magnacalcarata TaxID=392030 RepID=A0A8S2TQF2_9BILA|nr:unnamed protein product [Rotaria magnacalcarata]
MHIPLTPRPYPIVHPIDSYQIRSNWFFSYQDQIGCIRDKIKLILFNLRSNQIDCLPDMIKSIVFVISYVY